MQSPKNNSLVVGLAFSSLVFTTCTTAQTTPSEFAELSLQDLFQLSTDEQTESANKWSWTLQLRSVEYDGYLDGSDKLSLDEVLFVPGSENRTNKNFPVVPTVITQDVTLFGLNYQINQEWHAQVRIPYIQQATDHISIVPGYDEFLIKSSGVGDIVLSARCQFSTTTNGQWWLTAGLSLPTGSIDERGDTPRAPGDQQLPYTMQLGSGTYDLPVELQYHHLGKLDYTIALSATFRTGQNDRDYRLGNRYALHAKFNWSVSDTVGTFWGTDVIYSDSIKGRDEELLVPQTFPYPASITNPDLYGGSKVIVRAGFNWSFVEEYQLAFEYGKPLYQNLNGPQPRERWRTGLTLSKSL